MRIAFFVRHFGLRGTEVAVYDYAHYNETILKNESVVVSLECVPIVPSVLEKFERRFGRVVFLRSFGDIQDWINRAKIDVFHMLTSGFKEIAPYGRVDFNIPALVQTVFETRFSSQHGTNTRTVCIGEDLNMRLGTNVPVLPHIVTIAESPTTSINLRAELGIPESAIVYGRYGGKETFDIEYVRELVVEIANEREDIFFLFMNTDHFGPENHPRIIFLPPETDSQRKRRFIDATNAMLHARRTGETFSLAIGEFALCDKPIITCGIAYETMHFYILGNDGIYYKNKEELRSILLNNPLTPRPTNGYKKYTPEYVMQIFASLI